MTSLVIAETTGATLGEISTFITKGATPTTYGFSWEATGVPFLRSECVSERGLDMRQSMFISPAANQFLRRSKVSDGDILMTITGYVGRVIRLSGIGEGNINQHIARVRIKDRRFDPGYVYHYLSQPLIREYYESVVTGQAYPQISLTQVRETRIPGLPLKEQQAIAASLNSADELIMNLERMIAKKQAIKQGMLQQLLTGRTRLPGFDSPWRTRHLLDLVSIKSGQVDPRQREYRNLPLIAPDHVQSATGRLLKLETARAQGAISGKYLVAPGDVIYSKIRPYLRKVVQVDHPALCSADMYPLTPKPGVDGSFVLHTLLSERFTNFAVSASARSGIPKINRDELAEFTLPVPDLLEQQAISSALSQIDDQILSLGRELDKKKAIKQGMMQQLLTGRTRLPVKEGAA